MTQQDSKVLPNESFRKDAIDAETSDRKLPYIPALDGLRAVAILSVMAHHLNLPWLIGGYLGVDVFFVLSGFLITSLLVNEFDRSGNLFLKSFYGRRVRRLLPALAFMLLVFCIVSVLVVHDPIKLRRNFLDALLALVDLSNWSWAYGRPLDAAINQTWSLSTEEQFYLIWPAALLLMMRAKLSKLQLATTAFCVAILARSWAIFLSYHDSTYIRLYTGLDTHLDALMMGCTIALLLASPRVADMWMTRFSRWMMVLVPVSLLALLEAGLVFPVSDMRLYRYGYPMVITGVSVVILELFLNRRGILSRIFSSPVLVWVGAISYGLYLWHLPIFVVLVRMGYGRDWTFIIGAPLSIAVAAASYYAIERPIMRHGKRRNLGRPLQLIV